MTTDPRERLRRIDPSPVDAEPPSGAIEATAVIEEIERRMGMEPRETPDQPTITSSQQQQEAAPPPSAPDQVITAPQQRTSPGRRRPLLVGVGAIAAVLFVGAAGLGIVAVVGDDAPSPAAAPTATATPNTTQAPTTTTAPTITSDEAMAVSGGYIESFNSGDADAVLALFTSNVALSEKYTGMSDWGPIDRAFFEQQLAWNIAQGSIFVSAECAVTEDGAAAAVTVSCEFGWLDAAEKAVDAPPVPTVLTMVVTPDGISQAAFEYPPEFGVDSFDRWVGDNHSDNSEFVEFRDWNSVAEAEQSGILRAQYVSEWVAYLEANDCTYQDLFTDLGGRGNPDTPDIC
jgi:hypothetical protein